MAYAILGMLSVTAPSYAQTKIALGDGAVAKKNYDVAIGPNAVASGDGASINMALAIGGGAQASAGGAIAIGDNWNGGVKASGRDSIALGTSAAATQQSSVAIGFGASAAQANAVAIGAGSSTAAAIGTSVTNLNGSAFSFAGTKPTSTVSVGSLGNERTVTNVAAGRLSGTSTDSVNGSQLFATNTAVNTLGSQVASLGNSVATSLGGNSVYDSASGVLSTSLNYGGVSYGSVQDVLNQVNASVQGGGIKYLHVNSSLTDSSPLGTNSIALGPVATAGVADSVAIGNGATASMNVGDVALGSGSTTSTVVGTASTTLAGNTYAFAGAAPLSTVTIGSADNERTLTNVAAGRLEAGSTDAVNGSQLFASNSAINLISGQVTSLGNSLASGLGGGSSYNSSTGVLTTSLSYGGSTYGTVQDVLNHLSSVPQAASTKYLQVNSTSSGASAAGAGGVAVGSAAAANVTNAVAVGENATADANSGDVALGAGSATSSVVATRGASIGNVAYAFAGTTPTSTMSVGSVGDERTVTNVAAGRLSSTSTDAINGSQLFATNQQVSANTSAIQDLSNSVTNLAAGGASNKYFQVNSTGAASQAIGVEAIAAGSGAVSSGRAGVAQGVDAKAVGNGSVALGAGASATGVNSLALGAGSSDGGEANVVSVGSPSQQRRITNVASGTEASDAANVGQVDAVQAGSVQYDRNPDGSADYNSVSLGSDNGSAQIHRVANGTSASDAVNVSQLNSGIQTAENWSKNYVDQQVQSINRNINTVASRADAGVASAIAMAGLPQAYQPNQNAAAVAFGTYHGQTGMAVGVSSVTESGKWVYKLNLAGNTHGDGSASVGAARIW